MIGIAYFCTGVGRVYRVSSMFPMMISPILTSPNCNRIEVIKDQPCKSAPILQIAYHVKELVGNGKTSTRRKRPSPGNHLLFLPPVHLVLMLDVMPQRKLTLIYGPHRNMGEQSAPNTMEISHFYIRHGKTAVLYRLPMED